MVRGVPSEACGDERGMLLFLDTGRCKTVTFTRGGCALEKGLNIGTCAGLIVVWYPHRTSWYGYSMHLHFWPPYLQVSWGGRPRIEMGRPDGWRSSSSAPERTA